MTSERDIERLLDRWFAERPTEVAERVLDEVADRIGHQPQQPAWLIPWRDSHVNSYLKYAVAVAAIIVLAVVGLAALRPPADPGVGGVSPVPSPSPVASASPSTAPSSSAVFPSWYTQPGDGAGILPAGTQTTRHWIAGSTLTVPDGWVNDVDHREIYVLFADTPANEAEYARSKETAQNIVLVRTIVNNMVVFCDATGLFQGATAADVIDFVVANEALSTTEPVDVTIGGLSGQQIDIQLNPDWSGSCPVQADNPTRDYQDERSRFIALDTLDGRTIGIAMGSRHSADFEAFLAEAMPIVESLDVDAGPDASTSP